jgi:hypothetical protein
MADGATNNRIEAIRSVLTLEAPYEEASNINVTPGWLRRDETAPAEKQQSEYVPAHWRYDLCKAAFDRQPRLLLRRGERRDSSGRPALRVATRRHLLGAVLDEVRARSRDGRAALFNVG